MRRHERPERAIAASRVRYLSGSDPLRRRIIWAVVAIAFVCGVYYGDFREDPMRAQMVAHCARKAPEVSSHGGRMFQLTKNCRAQDERDAKRCVGVG
jgi:hypothetical protein